jgi:chromosome segregation ATPase
MDLNLSHEDTCELLDRPCAEKAQARIAELEAQLAAKEQTIADWRAAHERAAVIAAQEVDRQTEELRKQLAEAKSEFEARLLAEHNLREEENRVHFAEMEEIEAQLADALAAKEAAEKRAENQASRADSYARTAQAVLRDAGPALVEARDRAESAEARAADLAGVLTKVEAYMASEDGPLYRLWENCDMGDYDDYQTEWEQTLFDVRDWKNGCVPAASVGGGTEWPEVLLYREVLAALNPDTREKGEKE